MLHNVATDCVAHSPRRIKRTSQEVSKHPSSEESLLSEDYGLFDEEPVGVPKRAAKGESDQCRVILLLRFCITTVPLLHLH